MAPQSAVPTAGTTPARPARDPLRRGGPMTTKEKIAAAAAKRDRALKNSPREAPTPKAGSEPRSRPPPGEADMLAKAHNAGVQNTKTVSKSDRPLTTQRKIETATLAARATGPQTKTGAKTQEKKENEAKVPENKKSIQAKAPGMMAVLETHDSSSLRFKKERAPSAVLSRRTVRSSRLLERIRETAMQNLEVKKAWESDAMQRLLEHVRGARDKVSAALEVLRQDDGLKSIVERSLAARVLPAPGRLEILPVDLNPKATFRFLDLPITIRLDIYNLVVIDPSHFVDPELPTGQEQPDLAMVNRQIRAEVLPVFYARNIFTLDLTPRPVKRQSSTSLIILTRWARELEISGWFKHIKYWVLAYTPSTRPGEGDQDVMLSINFKREGGRCTGAVVELHREAFCILAGREERYECVIEQTPDWINSAVIDVCDAAKDGRGVVSGEMMVGLAMRVTERIGELIGLRCTKEGDPCKAL